MSGMTYGLRWAATSANLAESLYRRRTMRGQEMTASPDGGTGRKPKDPRNNPIGQSVTSVDPGGGDPPPVGTPPRPPYDGPRGGGSQKQK
jgi:hypothetical protein